ncbi:MAG: type II toxin-antitoxin system death-on-curing family toxin [Gammaproteobacteria bacterium]|nr:type II toxin-antitoxin system death-on-curing family toxin [Gammaproteobacteria bacterium]MDD9816414.1 type II toxin-antitoxin system death-on-curing family toxin [Gammaproteobacteria bacterium]MDD9870712.1 type II toxin-antitoxin system death-on-curing family toxin [Gammaproteobacteria bacterium]
MLYPEFDNPAIQREYERWVKKLEVSGAAMDAGTDTLNWREVLDAHFLVADYFAAEGDGLGNVGPRDRNGELLHSALSRQFVAFGGVQKWHTNYQVAATALFGLIKNHPFHDGNKRTALLSVLHLLEKQGYTAAVDKRKFESLTVAIADNRQRQNTLYKHLRSDYTADDADIAYIASRLNQMTRRLDRSHRALTYRQLNGLIKDHGYEMRGPKNNFIKIIRIDDGQVIGQVVFPGMSKQIARGSIKRVRRICGLMEEHGFDSKAFYNGIGGMDSLLLEYAGPLRRLADK